MFRNKWNWLYILLAALILFSLFAVPKVAIFSMNAAKGQIITLEPE